MIMEEENRPDMLPKIVETMKRVPEYKRRYAGKSIPPEKFAITKATAFLKEGSSTFQKMTLPAFELFYVWNIFGNTGENTQLLNPLVERIDKKMKQLREEGSEEYFVLVLLKGVCLRNLGRLQESIDGFREILNQEKDIKTVTYIPPHAAFELGISYLAIGEYVDAKDWLERARDHYTGFLIESLVHLRIHGAMTKLKELTKDSKTKNK
jgi:tetratricopeptide (TPR) repeat protein